MVVCEKENVHDVQVDELRRRLGSQLPQNYDTNCNLRRWLVNADKLSRSYGNVELAERNLRNHLRYRQALGLNGAVPSWDENPIYKNRLLPRGHFEWVESKGYFLWWVDYSTLNMSALIHTQKSTDVLIYHFWKYEQMLRMVNEKEKSLGVTCGVYAVIDLHQWPINPLTLLFVNDGQMGYYANLFHYEHYPELVNPINVINAPTWLSVPYGLVKRTMPKDFGNRCRIFNHHYAATIFQDIPAQCVSTDLGGANSQLKPFVTTPSQFGKHSEWTLAEGKVVTSDLQHLTVSARRRRVVVVDCRAGSTLSWHFTTDGALMFGIFYTDQVVTADGDDNQQEATVDLDQLTMVYPMLRFAAKHVAETGSLPCAKTGTYCLTFCNRTSWFSRRHVHIKLELENEEGRVKCNLSRSLSA